MNATTLFPDWRKKVVYSPSGPQPAVLGADEKVKMILVGLEPGQHIPEHPEVAAIYYFLEGTGCMTVDGQPYEVGAGATMVMPDGAARGLDAHTRLAFLAVRIA